MPFTLRRDFTLRVVPTGQGPVPESLVGNPGQFSQLAGQTSVSQRGVTFHFNGPRIVGTNAAGELWVWNGPSEPELRVTRIEPDGGTQEITNLFTGLPYTRITNGAMLNAGNAAQFVAYDADGGFDRYPKNNNGFTYYRDELNVEPETTGNDIVFAPGQEGTITKGVSLATPNPDARQLLNRRVVLHVVRKIPTVGDYGPGEASVRKKVKPAWNEANVDLTRLPNYSTSLISAWPAITATQLRHVQEPRLVHATGRPSGDRWTGVSIEDNYAPYGMRDWMQIALRLCYDIDPAEKRIIANGIIRNGIDVWERVKAGGRWIENGLGGVLCGHKMPLAIAAYLLDDQEMIDWCTTPRTTFAAAVFPEDIQVQEITQDLIDNYDYISDDLGMGDWIQNIFTTSPGTHAITRNYGVVYRGAHKTHHSAEVAMLAAIPELLAVFNPSNAYMNYGDRCMFREFWKNRGYGDNESIFPTPFLYLDYTVDVIPVLSREIIRTTRQEAAENRAIWNWPD